MDLLPQELISHICSFVSTVSLKTLRLCCKSFAIIGEEYLFKDFEFRLYPNHHRIHQLEQLAANAAVASRLRCLSFESGVPLEYADYRYWQAQVYHFISSTWSQNLAVRGASNDAYGQFHAGLQGRFTADMPRRYQLYRWHMDQESALIAEPSVQNSLIRSMTALSKHCLNVKFKVVMAEPEVTLEDLEAFDISLYAHETPQDLDPRRMVYNRRQRCLNHFSNFLHSAIRSELEVDELIAVQLPYQLLTMDMFGGVGMLAELFTSLRKIDLKLNSLPHSDWLSRQGLSELYLGGRHPGAKQLPLLLNRTTVLEELRLELPPGKEAEFSFDLFDRTNIDRFPKLWLSHLHVLELSKFRCTLQDLQALLRDARSLKSLGLGSCRLETGSMIDLMYFMPSLHLESFNISGTWHVDEDSGEWHSHTSYDFSDCRSATDYEGPYVTNGVRAKVELFMLAGKDSCPLPRWRPDTNVQEIWEMLGDTSWHFIH